MTEQIQIEQQRGRLRCFVAGKGLKLYRQRYFLEQPESECRGWVENGSMETVLTSLDRTHFISGNPRFVARLVESAPQVRGKCFSESAETLKALDHLLPGVDPRENYLMTTNRKEFSPVPHPDAFEFSDNDIGEFAALGLSESKGGWRGPFIHAGLRCDNKAVAMARAGHFLRGVGAFVLNNLTLPEYRGRGFSKQVMSLLVGLCLEKYPAVLLYGPLEGHPAYSVYGRIGFKTIAKHYVFRLSVAD